MKKKTALGRSLSKISTTGTDSTAAKGLFFEGHIPANPQMQTEVDKLLLEKRPRGRPPGSVKKLPVPADESKASGIFPANEICRIIEQCNKSKVASFNFNGLSLTFSTDSKITADKRAGPAQKFLQDVQTPQEITYPNAQFLEEEARQATLAVTDPVSYEREQVDLLVNGPLPRMGLNEERENSFRSQ